MKGIKILVLGSLCLGLAFGAKSISDTELGLRQTPLGDEKDVKLQDFQYSNKAPGESQVFDRAYENAPPMIPHDTEGMTDFTQSTNACLDCHSVEVAPSVGALPIPPSHRTDLRTGKKIANDGVSDSRWNCTQCHAPQSNAKPLVGNNFKPQYRNQKSKNFSNLLDVIQEGVK